MKFKDHNNQSQRVDLSIFIREISPSVPTKTGYQG